MHNLNKLIRAHLPLFIFLLLYLVVRVVLINVNYTEWGDTFRMIRAAEFLSKGSWPWDEKRWPFYSAILIPGIWLNAPIFFGRVLSILISLASAIYIYSFYLKYISRNKFYAVTAVIIVLTSSVFAYWGFRVMADPLFALLVLVFFYYFPDIFIKLKSIRLVWLLSAVLLIITMTRLEGLFVASATGLFLLGYSAKSNHLLHKVTELAKNIKVNLSKLLVFFIPQFLVYLPWTIYAKFLYKGDINNNYLDEVETFVFNLDRLKYFLTYTIFILVIPITFYFAWIGIQKIIKSSKAIYLLPLAIFILQEFLIGFIWTPSLPRIYMPVIPFLVIGFIYGVEVFKREKLDIKKYIVINLVLTFLFAYLQYAQRLYFLGASKILFAGIIFLNLILIGLILFRNSKKLFVSVAILLNLLISCIIVYNQRHIYESVMKGVGFVLPLDGITGYSDETGNTEWYLRNKGVYLDRINTMDDLDEQYLLLKDAKVSYMLWTDEFNRGSHFLDPRADPRFSLIYVYRQPIQDPLDIVADKLNILDDSDYTVFTTKIYKVN